MPSAYTSFVLFFLLLVFGLANAPVFYDPDTAWHLASGDAIRLSHAVPRHDSWSFTAGTDNWYNLSWLFDLGLAQLFHYGSFSAVYAITILIFALSLTLMARHAVRRGASPIIVLLLLLPIAPNIYTSILARPNLCSILLTVIFYLILHDYSRNGRFCRLLLLPGLMAFWVNLHGGFLLAFPLIGCFLAGAVLERNRTHSTAYTAILALCLLATLINPYGFAVYYGAYRTVAAAFSHVLMEWKPVEIGHNLPMTLVLLLMLCIGDFSDRKIPFADRALAVFILLLALSSLRHCAVAALLLMPYLALRATSLAYGSRIGKRIRNIDTAIMADMGKTDIRMLALAMVLAAGALIALPWPRDAILAEPAGFRKAHFPVKEAAFIADYYPGLRFLNSYNIGGYLDYIWQGKVKVFVDGRANSLYSDDVLNDYKAFTENHGFGGRAEMIAAQYRLDGLIIANDDEDAGLWRWNPDWKVVYSGDAATVYLHKSY